MGKATALTHPARYTPMSALDRLYRLHQCLSHARRPRSTTELAEELECSAPTVKRLIQRLRDHYAAPIEWDREHRGYRYRTGDTRFELPGLWFSERELHALLMADHLLTQAGPGLFASELASLRERIRTLLDRVAPGRAVESWVQIKTQGRRAVDAEVFRVVANAILAGRGLAFQYRGRVNDRSRPRRTAPERLIHYRDNWYLLAQCLEARDWRIFALDRIRNPTPIALDKVVLDQPAPALSGYGLLAGPETQMAELLFAPERARWIGDENWHPAQQQEWLPDGRLRLRFPIGDLRELVLDVLRYGDEVEVRAPPALREMVRQRLRAAVAQYEQ